MNHFNDHIINIYKIIDEDNEDLISPGNLRPSRKKRLRKKRPKQYKVDLATGKPKDKDAEILYSDIEKNNNLTEARRIIKSPKESINKKKMDFAKEITPPPIITRSTSSILDNGGLSQLSSRDPNIQTKLQDVIENSDSIITNSKSFLFRIVSMLKRQLGPDAPNCKIIKEFHILNHLLDKEAGYKYAQDAWPVGIGMPLPSKGWWGINHWTAPRLSYYFRIYVKQIFHRFLKDSREVIREHKALCNDEKCASVDHANFVINGFCGGFKSNDGLLTISSTARKLSKERLLALNAFKRQKKTTLPSLSKSDKERYKQAKQKSVEQGTNPAFIDPHSTFSDFYKKLYGLTQDESYILSINNLISEDPNDINSGL